MKRRAGRSQESGGQSGVGSGEETAEQKEARPFCCCTPFECAASTAQSADSCERSLLAGSTLALERDHDKKLHIKDNKVIRETQAGEEYYYFAFLTGGFFCIASVLRVCWRMVANGDAANDSFLMMAGRRVDSAVLSIENMNRSERVHDRA